MESCLWMNARDFRQNTQPQISKDDHIQTGKSNIAAIKKLLKLIRKNPDVSGCTDKYSDSVQFSNFRMKVRGY